MFMKMLKIVGATALIAGLVVLNVAVGQASAEATAGFGPETAIAPTVGWTTVEPGTTHWYTFDYDYVDGDEGDSNTPKQAIALLEMATPGSVEFTVQTMERLGPWASEDEDPGHVGVGSPLYLGTDDDNDSVYSAHELVWAGSAKASGSYLIIVEGDGAYQLTVDGETVNFTQPALDGAVAFAGMASPSEMSDGPQMVAMASDAGEVQSETFALAIEAAPAAIMAGSSPCERGGAHNWMGDGEARGEPLVPGSTMTTFTRTKAMTMSRRRRLRRWRWPIPAVWDLSSRPRTASVRGWTKTMILGF